MARHVYLQRQQVSCVNQNWQEKPHVGLTTERGIEQGVEEQMERVREKARVEGEAYMTTVMIFSSLEPLEQT